MSINLNDSSFKSLDGGDKALTDRFMLRSEDFLLTKLELKFPLPRGKLQHFNHI